MTLPTTPKRRAWISVAAPVSELRKTKSSNCCEAPRSNLPSPRNSCPTPPVSTISTVGTATWATAWSRAGRACSPGTPAPVKAASWPRSRPTACTAVRTCCSTAWPEDCGAITTSSSAGFPASNASASASSRNNPTSVRPRLRSVRAASAPVAVTSMPEDSSSAVRAWASADSGPEMDTRAWPLPAPNCEPSSRISMRGKMNTKKMFDLSRRKRRSSTVAIAVMAFIPAPPGPAGSAKGQRRPRRRPA
jgi:hypothetical protein